jgi:hypothetical protein
MFPSGACCLCLRPHQGDAFAVALEDVEAYYAVKDPVCDLSVIAAEQWASDAGWTA